VVFFLAALLAIEPDQEQWMDCHAPSAEPKKNAEVGFESLDMEFVRYALRMVTVRKLTPLGPVDSEEEIY
jgi:hypothetical protein